MRAITESDLLKLYNYLVLREGNDSGENPKLGILQYTIFVLSFLWCWRMDEALSLTGANAPSHSRTN